MKLYEVPNQSRIRVLANIVTPQHSINIEESEELFFSHIDGMYSVCYNSKHEIVHLVAWAEVEVIE